MWFEKQKLVVCEYKMYDNNTRVILKPEHLLKMLLLDTKLRGLEWLVIGKGIVRRSTVTDYVVSELVVPRQVVSSAHVSVEPGNSVNGIVEIHRHPFNMSSFSSTDIEYFNYPVMMLVYDDFKIRAVVKRTLPCGLRGIAEVTVYVDDNGRLVEVNQYLSNLVSLDNIEVRGVVYGKDKDIEQENIESDIEESGSRYHEARAKYIII